MRSLNRLKAAVKKKKRIRTYQSALHLGSNIVFWNFPWTFYIYSIKCEGVKSLKNKAKEIETERLGYVLRVWFSSKEEEETQLLVPNWKQRFWSDIKKKLVNEYIYELCIKMKCLCGFMVFILSWPFWLTNYRSMSWDKSFAMCFCFFLTYFPLMPPYFVPVPCPHPTSFLCHLIVSDLRGIV